MSSGFFAGHLQGRAADMAPRAHRDYSKQNYVTLDSGFQSFHVTFSGTFDELEAMVAEMARVVGELRRRTESTVEVVR